MKNLRELKRSGKPLLNGWLSIPDPLVAEVMSRQGFDSLCIDMQHGMVDFAHLPPMLQAIGLGGAFPLVRIPSNDSAAAMKALDAGAMGVVVPLVNDAEEAGRAVAACRYPPAGIRSYGPTRAALVAGSDYASRANAEILVFAMIETVGGLDNLEEICATTGLDGIYIGPADLSYALGLPPEADNEHAEHGAAVARIVEVAHEHDLIVGLHCSSPDFARGALERGLDMVTVASDFNCLRDEAARRVQMVRGGAG